MAAAGRRPPVVGIGDFFFFFSFEESERESYMMLEHFQAFPHLNL